MPKFNVGDRVVGNYHARVYYRITTEGWIGTVVAVLDSEQYITVKDDNGDEFGVLADCFNLVESASIDELESAKIDEFFSEFQ